MGMVSYSLSGRAFHLDCSTNTDIGKAVTEEEKLQLIKGASEEAILLAEISYNMLARFNNYEKLSQQDFNAIWHAHVNLSILWKEALSMEHAPPNGRLN